MFENRKKAGQLLAEKLKHLKDENLIVLAIPRGGVPVGAEIAKALNCPLDIVVTKKIGAPGNPELAIGAVGGGGVKVIDQNLARRTGADEDYLKREIKRLSNEVIKKEERLRGKREPLEIRDKTVILTDDGIATGATVEAAIKVVKSQGPIKIVVAMPVAPPDSVKKLEPLVDEFICLKTPSFFAAVGQFYQEFSQIEDEEVIKILATINNLTMYLLVGLGNPGKKYQDTRHNVGFMVVDQLAKEWRVGFKWDEKLASLRAPQNQTPAALVRGRLEKTDGTEVILAKPMTFMNKSGRAVERLVTCYMLHVTSLIIVHDDLDIPLGKFKIQFGRGPRQHKGVESIEQALGTKDFWRVRIGIENRKEKLRNSVASLAEIKKLRKKKRKISGEEYVLEKFTQEERRIIDKVILAVIDEIKKRFNLF